MNSDRSARNLCSERFLATTSHLAHLTFHTSSRVSLDRFRAITIARYHKPFIQALESFYTWLYAYRMYYRTRSIMRVGGCERHIKEIRPFHYRLGNIDLKLRVDSSSHSDLGKHDRFTLPDDKKIWGQENRKMKKIN